MECSTVVSDLLVRQLIGIPISSVERVQLPYSSHSTDIRQDVATIGFTSRRNVLHMSVILHETITSLKKRKMALSLELFFGKQESAGRVDPAPRGSQETMS